MASDPISISAPKSATVGLSQANPVAGITVVGPPSTDNITLTVSDKTGKFAATAGTGGDTVVPEGTTLIITGTLNQVNGDLTTLTDTEPVNSDTITVNATDNTNGENATPVSIAVTANSVPEITAPVSVTVQQNAAIKIPSLSITESGNTTTGFGNQPGGEQFTVMLSDSSGKLAADFGATGGGAIHPSADGTNLTISGSLHDVNADLTTLTVTEPSAATPDTITVLASDQFGNNAAAKQIGLNVGTEPSVIPPPAMPANFSVTDVTTSEVGTTAGEPYPSNGPVAGLDQQLIMQTPDDLAILANVPNTFIHTGSGDDAIKFIGGTNIADGSTGSNFLTGGSGLDTFYLDDRNSTADTWSSIVGFHSGDDATVWGLTPQDFHINHFDNQGAVNAKGLTFSITAPGHPDANLTLAGYTTDDLSNGKLSVSFGRTNDLPGLPGSNYMLIHAT